VGSEIVFLSRIGTRNIGDDLCSPYHYFKQRFPKSIQAEFHLSEGKRDRWYLKLKLSPILIRSRALIIGGGGLLGLDYFADDLRYWSSSWFSSKVLWGPGHNAHDALAVDQRNAQSYEYESMDRFDKVGIRDWGVGYNWVPCVSCMHPELSLPVSQESGLVAALHYESRASEGFVPALVKASQEPVDVVYNDGSVEEFLGKIRTAKAVVTNSYHAAYWATLFGKRVAVVGGGSKVCLLKHQPILADANNWVEKLEEAQIFSHALEECRERNLAYADEIAGFLL